MARGRPRKIDPDEALEKALVLFWKRGYAGASMNDISAATGMAKPGLYANFGDKDALFIKSVERYVAEFGDPVRLPFEQGRGPLRDDLRTYLNGLADGMTLGDRPKGCLCILASFEFGDVDGPVGERLAELRGLGGQALMQRLTLAKSKGEITPDAALSKLVLFLSAQIVALATMARTGATREALQVLVDMALEAMPWADPQDGSASVA